MTATCVTLTRYFYPVAERSDPDLADQLAAASIWVDAKVTCPLLECQREALTCLLSDVLAGLVTTPSGIPFEDTFLLTALNKQMYQIAAAEFHHFCYVGGRLQTRASQKRRAEQVLFVKGTLLF